MDENYNAFEMSPVPPPGPTAVPPGIHRGIYGMPMFVTLPTPDLDASRDFWIRGLGFIDLFTIPAQLTHLRRWAFQDVLLVPAEHSALGGPSSMTVSFACVLSEISAIAEACSALDPSSVGEPRSTSWNTVDLAVTTPENTRVIFTAGRELDPHSVQADELRSIGIDVPG